MDLSSNLKKTTNSIWSLESESTSVTETRLTKDASDVKFFDNENFIVADSVGHNLLLFNVSDNKALSGFQVDNENGDDGVCIFEYGIHKYKKLLSDRVWPNCLAITQDSKIRLTDRKTKTIRTYDIRGDLISVWSGGDDVMGQPQGIAVTSMKETVVSDTSKNCIHVFSENGELLRSFGSVGDLLHHLRLPFYLTVDSQNHILISDNMNYCVKIFDTYGNFQTRIGSGNLFGQRQFQSPYGVCYDSISDEILVADHESNKIFAYNTSGEFQRYAVTGSECSSPCGLDVCGESGLLALTMSNPDLSNVKVFKIENSK